MFQLLNITDYPIESHLQQEVKSLLAVVKINLSDNSLCLRKYLLQSPPQIIFLNIDLNIIQEINNLPIRVRNKIFWVGIAQEYQVGFMALKNGFFDVLLKPWEVEKLNFILERIIQKLLIRKRPITISCPKETRYLTTIAILYIKADNNYVSIYLKDGDCFTVFNTLTHFQETLLFPFIRVHKSYIVNAHHISRIHFTKKFIKLKGCDQFIPYSNTYTKQLEKIDILKRITII